MLDQKDFRESFPEAMKGFATQLWEAEGRSPSQAEASAHAWSWWNGNGRMPPGQGKEFGMTSTRYPWEGSRWTPIMEGFVDHAQDLEFTLSIGELLKNTKHCSDQIFLFQGHSVK